MMATDRPLFRLGIADLEDIFKKPSIDLTELSQLKHELSYRQVPRAYALLEQIRKAELQIVNIANADDPKITTTEFGEVPIFNKPTTEDLNTFKIPTNIKQSQNEKKDNNLNVEVPVFLTNAPKQLDLLSRISQPKENFFTEDLPTKKIVSSPEKQPLPQIALDDAYKILKIGFGESWEKIEAARRKIVQKSNPIISSSLPKNKIKELLSEAKLANDATVVIAARRSGVQ